MYSIYVILGISWELFMVKIGSRTHEKSFEPKSAVSFANLGIKLVLLSIDGSLHYRLNNYYI